MDEAQQKPSPETEADKPRPALRGKLYSRLNVSVHTMDIIIVAVCILLLLALFFGIALGR